METDRPFCVQRHIAILKPASEMDLRFLVYLLTSPLVYEQASNSTTGTAQPTIALRPVRNFLVPVPPLAEQHRIVAKVDELMALCDRLKASLTETEAGACSKRCSTRYWRRWRARWRRRIDHSDARATDPRRSQGDLDQ